MYMFWMIDRFVLQFKIETNNWRCDRTCKYAGQTEETKIQITAKKETKEAADSGLRNKLDMFRDLFHYPKFTMGEKSILFLFSEVFIPLFNVEFLL